MLNRYKQEQLTEIEVKTIIFQQETLSSADLYESNKKIMQWLTVGFILKRADIKSALKVGLILLLDEHGYPPVERDEVYVGIFEQAENF